ncbi:MBL fold metallo-hydrolase [Stomatohabitans albus]|uniref:MBL fold metallo-hydrolase n=1 Tax=Stomatohabitans albus TaxID=3110766 RepID=UPI00300D090C
MSSHIQIPIELPGGLSIHRSIEGVLDTNVWLIRQPSGVAVLIDPADNAPGIQSLIGDDDVALVVVTHQHADHIEALREIAKTTEADVVAGTPDCTAIEFHTSVRPDPVWHGDRIEVDDIVLDVIGLVGHTPGGIALALITDGAPVHIFPGDSLFPGGPGKTLNPEDFQSLMTDLEEKIFDQYGDDTVILPGHGEGTTLGKERSHIDEWWARGW